MTLAIAHRGDPHAHRENTLPALLSAVGQGADMVELDVRLTGDGQAVLLHDEDLRRLWGHPVRLADLTWAEVQQRGGDGYAVPSFESVLATVPAPLMVDLPESAAAGPALALVEQYGALDRCLFVTSDVAALTLIRERAPAARIGLSWPHRELPDRGVLRDLRAEYFNPVWMVLAVYDDVVAAMHDAGYLVSCWTVDSPTNMHRLLQRGVDAIITNRLPFLLQLLGDHTGRGAAC